MSEIYTFMYKDIKLGVFTHEMKEGIDWYTFTLTNKNVKPTMLPATFYGFRNKDVNKKIQQVDILRFIDGRVMPRNRQLLEVYLQSIGLKHYNKWEIVKHNKGMSYKDYFWLASIGDVYQHVHPRYAMDIGLPIKPKNIFNIRELD